MKKHVELNVHSCGADRETVITPKEIAEFASENGSDAVAITDLESVWSVNELDMAIQRESLKIKPIYGVRLNCKKNGEEFLITLLAKTRSGLRNIYRILSEYNGITQYNESRKIVGWKYVLENKEGISVGRECTEELIAGFRGKSTSDLEKELEKLFEGVDHVEITPTENPELRETAYKTVGVLQKLGKLPVAVSNANCITTEDKLCFDLLHRDDKKVRASFLKTTEEFLKDFSFLKELAETVVVENTNKVAETVESFRLDPGPADYVIPGAEEEIKRRSQSAAEKKYGKDLPEKIKERMEDEFRKIGLCNNWSLFLLAAKLVEKADKLGYPHGIRGCAGSSFIAYLLGITDIDPLPLHYYCPDCKNVEFAEKTGERSDFGAVLTKKRKKCPRCGGLAEADGYDIPCEFFLGYIGERVPDFEIEFSKFNVEDPFRYLEDTAEGCRIIRGGNTRTVGREVSSWMIDEYRNEDGTTVEDGQKERLIARLANVCAGVGVVPEHLFVVPKEVDVFDHTPIGLLLADLAFGKTKPYTLIDFHHLFLEKIKLIYGDQLSQLELMEHYSGVKFKDIAPDESEIKSLFNGETDARGLPFITDFKRELYEAISPENFSELLKLYGFAHGTGVWKDNAEVLLKEGHPVEELIAHREDVMQILEKSGVDRKNAFYIGEYVRRGKAARMGFTDEQVSLMHEKGVPEWLIGSMKKISYLSPRSNSVGKLTNQIRIMWYKIHQPLAFYSAVFSNDITAALDYCILAKGRARVKSEYDLFNRLWGKDYDFSLRSDEGDSAAEKRVLELALECFDKGISFLPVDINVSDPRLFVPENGNIRIPYNVPESIPPETVGVIEKQKAERPFCSALDFNMRVLPDEYTKKAIKRIYKRLP